MKVFPVYDLAGTPSTQAQTTGSPLITVQTVGAQTLSNSAMVAGIQISLDQVMETENGFILTGSKSWKGMENTEDVYLGLDTRLLDARGAVIPTETYFPGGGISPENQSAAWALETNSKAHPGPWKLSIPSVLIQRTSEVSFELDLGTAPSLGQTWNLNTQLNIAGHTLVVQKAEMTQGPGLDGTFYLDFTFSGGPELLQVSVSDPDNHSARIAGKGSSAESGAITSAFSYDGLPTGKRKIVVTSLTYIQQGPWILGWQPPTTSASLAAPTPLPPACLTEEKWQKVRSQAQGLLPQGVGGQILVEQQTGGLMPQITLVNVVTGQKHAIAIGAWSSLSPDGSRVAYGESNGKNILIAPADGGQPHALAGTTERDSEPVWSPDGNWIAFTRANDGIYLIHPDGSGSKRLTDSNIQARPVGWMPDNRSLVIAVMTASGDQAESVDITTGAIQTLLTADNHKEGIKALSPDGKQAAFSEKIFGQPYPGEWIAALDGSGRKLIAALDSAMSTITAWSPDGKWVVVVVSEAQRDTNIETLLLVQPETCQVAALPGISGTITGWR
jgi:WD40 repeat protein